MLGICCAIMQAEVLVFCLLVSLYQNTVTFVWMVSPYIQHMNTQFSTNILYFNIGFKPLVKTHLIFVNCFNVLFNISFKEHLPEDGHNRWSKHVGGLILILAWSPPQQTRKQDHKDTAQHWIITAPHHPTLPGNRWPQELYQELYEVNIFSLILL
jgi:hypothetical protein